MSQQKEIVKVEHVDFGYDGHLVLEDITLTVQESDFMGVIGPNGSGKTTLLKIMLGLIHPLRGKVRVFGQPP
ncbi:MAG: ATP-binding cassette domain-containing protein, partial [Desulfobacterales bacterium]